MTCHVPDCGNVACDVCGERMTCLGPEPATTCGAHVECVDCAGANPCRDCRVAREAVAS